MAKVLYALGRVHLHHGWPGQALRLFQLGLVQAQQTEYRRAEALLHANLGWAHAVNGDPRQALASAERGPRRLHALRAGPGAVLAALLRLGRTAGVAGDDVGPPAGVGRQSPGPGDRTVHHQPRDARAADGPDPYVRADQRMSWLCSAGPSSRPSRSVTGPSIWPNRSGRSGWWTGSHRCGRPWPGGRRWPISATWRNGLTTLRGAAPPPRHHQAVHHRVDVRAVDLLAISYRAAGRRTVHHESSITIVYFGAG